MCYDRSGQVLKSGRVSNVSMCGAESVILEDHLLGKSQDEIRAAAKQYQDLLKEQEKAVKEEKGSRG